MKQLFPVALAILLFSGCVYQPIQDSSELAPLEIPEQWSGDAVKGEHTQDSWLESLGDDALVRYVEQAVEDNYTLKAGLARLSQADANVRLQGGGKYPTFGIDFTHGMQESFSEVYGVIKTDVNTLTLSSSWEIDFWGRIRGEQAAAFAQLQAAGYSYADLMLTLQSTIAKTWFSAIEAKLQWQLAVRTRDSFLKNLDTLEDRYQRGIIEAFDLRLFRSQASANEAVLKQREVTYRSIVMQLQSLANQVPNGKIELPQELPVYSETVAIDLPSEVLLRRPDIRSAERQLAAMLGQRDAMAKNWLPSFRISGSWGTSSNEIGELIDGDRLIWSLFGNITAPLLQGGRLKAQRDLTEAQFQEQVFIFSQTLLDALREVEVALSRETLLLEMQEVMALSTREAKSAESLSWDLYNRGLLDITAVLDTQRRASSAESEWISVCSQRIQNRIDLHVGLGGGFDADDVNVDNLTEVAANE